MGNLESLDDLSKNSKILDSYKVLLLLNAYGHDNKDPYPYPYYGHKTDFAENKLTHGRFRWKIENFIKSKNFSEVDDMSLKLIEKHDFRDKIYYKLDKLKGFVGYYDEEFPTFYGSRFMNGGVDLTLFPVPVEALPNEDVKLLKKLHFLTGGPKENIHQRIKEFFGSDSYAKSIKESFIDSVRLEVERREKAIEKQGVSKTASLDDNALGELRKKVLRCTTLNDLGDILSVYKTPAGVDLMNGLLNGNLSGIRSKKLTVKIPTDSIKRQKNGAYGTDFSEIPLNLVLDTIIKALRLNGFLKVNKGGLKGINTVYKGLTIERLLSDTGVSKSDFFRQVFKNRDMKRIAKGGQVEEHVNFEKMAITEKHVLKYVNESNPKPIYTSKAFISTSLDSEMANIYAKGHAAGKLVPIILKITIDDSKVKGINFAAENIGHGNGDYEVLLQPNTKFELEKATLLYSGGVQIECKTK